MIERAVPVLHVTRARASQDFYCRGLGFQLEFDVGVHGEPDDPRYFSVRRDGVAIHLSSHGGDAVVGGVAYLYVTDVDALHDEFRGRGIPIHIAPVDQTWGMRELYVKDPDGNCIRFGCPVR